MAKESVPILNLPLPLKTPEPNIGQAAKKIKRKAIYLANGESSEKLNALKSEGEEDHSLFQYTPSNYYDASGGGGTGATTRFYRDLYLKQLNHRSDSPFENDEMAPIEEGKSNASEDDDSDLIESRHHDELTSTEDYKFLAHLKEFSNYQLQNTN